MCYRLRLLERSMAATKGAAGEHGAALSEQFFNTIVSRTRTRIVQLLRVQRRCAASRSITPPWGLRQETRLVLQHTPCHAV
jgi:hypothetical protein